MKLPENPIYCDICETKSMVITIAKQPDGKMKPVGICSLPLFITDKPTHLNPNTALCSTCGQVKFFLEFTDTITK